MLFVHFVLLMVLFLLSVLRFSSNGTVKYVGNPFVIVLTVYLFSAVSALFVPQELFPTFDFYSHRFYLYLLYTFFVLLSLSPIIITKGYCLPNVVFHVTAGVKLIFFILAALILFAFLYQLPYAIEALQVGAIDIRVGVGGEKTNILPENIFTTIAVAVSSFYVVFIFLFFISLKQKMSRWITFMMFLGGLCYVVSSICFAARDGALFYVLTNIFAYQLFKNQLPRKVKERVSRLLAIAGGLVTLFLVAFTYQRFFDTSSSHSGLEGTLGYIGQQPFVFVENIIQRREYYGWDLRFPLIEIISGGEVDQIFRTMPYEWSFGTFLSDYYSAFGWSSLLGLSLLGTFVFAIIFLRRNFIHPFVFSLLIAFYFQLMVSGVFYLRLGNWAGNVYMAIMIIAILYMSIFYRVKKY